MLLQTAVSYTTSSVLMEHVMLSSKNVCH